MASNRRSRDGKSSHLSPVLLTLTELAWLGLIIFAMLFTRSQQQLGVTSETLEETRDELQAAMDEASRRAANLPDLADRTPLERLEYWAKIGLAHQATFERLAEKVPAEFRSGEQAAEAELEGALEKLIAEAEAAARDRATIAAAAAGLPAMYEGDDLERLVAFAKDAEEFLSTYAGGDPVADAGGAEDPWERAAAVVAALNAQAAAARRTRAQIESAAASLPVGYDRESLEGLVAFAEDALGFLRTGADLEAPTENEDPWADVQQVMAALRAASARADRFDQWLREQGAALPEGYDRDSVQGLSKFTEDALAFLRRYGDLQDFRPTTEEPWQELESGMESLVAAAKLAEEYQQAFLAQGARLPEGYDAQTLQGILEFNDEALQFLASYRQLPGVNVEEAYTWDALERDARALANLAQRAEPLEQTISEQAKNLPPGFEQNLQGLLEFNQKALAFLSTLPGEPPNFERAGSVIGDITRELVLLRSGELVIRQELLGLEQGTLDRVAVLFDTSGSMRQTGRWDNARKVVKTWLQYLPIEEAVFVPFGNYASPFPREGLVRLRREEGGLETQALDEMMSLVDGLEISGDTNTLQALEEAYQRDNLSSVLLFTDGQPRVGIGDQAAYLEQINQLVASHPDTRIYVVGLGDYLRNLEFVEYMQGLADRTGGAFIGR